MSTAINDKLIKLSVIQLQARLESGKFTEEEIPFATAMLKKRQDAAAKASGKTAPAAKEKAEKGVAKEKVVKEKKEKVVKEKKGRVPQEEGKSAELRKRFLNVDKTTKVTKLTMGEVIREVEALGYSVYHSEAKRVADKLIAEGLITAVAKKEPVVKKEKPVAPEVPVVEEKKGKGKGKKDAKVEEPEPEPILEEVGDINGGDIDGNLEENDIED